MGPQKEAQQRELQVATPELFGDEYEKIWRLQCKSRCTKSLVCF